MIYALIGLAIIGLALAGAGAFLVLGLVRFFRELGCLP